MRAMQVKKQVKGKGRKTRQPASRPVVMVKPKIPAAAPPPE